MLSGYFVSKLRYVFLLLLYFCFLEENFASVTKGAVTPRQFSSETCIATAVAVEIVRVTPPLVTTCLATKNCFASWSKSNTSLLLFVTLRVTWQLLVYVFCNFSLNALSKITLQVGKKIPACNSALTSHVHSNRQQKFKKSFPNNVPSFATPTTP